MLVCVPRVMLAAASLLAGTITTGASVLGCSKEKTAWAYAAKHIASLSKMVNEPDDHPIEEWLEKCGDLANYACLIYAMRYGKVKDEQRR